MTQDVAREADRGHLEESVLSLMGLGIRMEPAVCGLGGDEALQMCGKRRRLRTMSSWRDLNNGWIRSREEGGGRTSCGAVETGYKPQVVC
jgi:hypothetical protein